MVGDSLADTPPPPSRFQGQVTRAQEAEENYVIKRELAVVRQQCSSANESLEKAQDTIRELQQQKVSGGLVAPSSSQDRRNPSPAAFRTGNKPPNHRRDHVNHQLVLTEEGISTSRR